MSRRGGGDGWCPPMDLMRSEAMQLVQVIIPAESAHLTVSNLGDLGLLQFKDLNADKSPFQRAYAAQIKRCGEMARKLRFFKEQMSKAAILTSSVQFSEIPLEIADLEIKLGEFEAELTEVNANNGKLQRTYNELVEYNVLLQKIGQFFYSAQRSATQQQGEMVADVESPLLEQEMVTDPSKQVKLGFLSGLVPKHKAMPFERILFRATRGNMLLRQESVDETVTDPQTGEKVVKNSFVIFYSGERAKSKIVKICDAFGANRYPFPEDLTKQLHTIQEVYWFSSLKCGHQFCRATDGKRQWCMNLVPNAAQEAQQLPLHARLPCPQHHQDLVLEEVREGKVEAKKAIVKQSSHSSGAPKGSSSKTKEEVLLEEKKRTVRKNKGLRNQYPISKGMEVGLASPNSFDLVAQGTIQTADPDAIGLDGHPLSDYVEVMINVVHKGKTMLPRPRGRMIKMASAQAKCVPWPRNCLTNTDGSCLDIVVENIVSNLTKSAADPAGGTQGSGKKMKKLAAFTPPMKALSAL